MHLRSILNPEGSVPDNSSGGGGDGRDRHPDFPMLPADTRTDRDGIPIYHAAMRLPRPTDRRAICEFLGLADGMGANVVAHAAAGDASSSADGLIRVLVESYVARGRPGGPALPARHGIAALSTLVAPLSLTCQIVPRPCYIASTTHTHTHEPRRHPNVHLFHIPHHFTTQPSNTDRPLPSRPQIKLTVCLRTPRRPRNTPGPAPPFRSRHRRPRRDGPDLGQPLGRRLILVLLPGRARGPRPPPVLQQQVPDVGARGRRRHRAQERGSPRAAVGAAAAGGWAQLAGRKVVVFVCVKNGVRKSEAVAFRQSIYPSRLGERADAMDLGI